MGGNCALSEREVEGYTRETKGTSGASWEGLRGEYGGRAGRKGQRICGEEKEKAEGAKCPLIPQAAQLCFSSAAKCCSATESCHMGTEAPFYKPRCSSHCRGGEK